MARDTVAVNYRVKSFEGAATTAFAFLTDLGFEHSTSHSGDQSRRPFALTVAFVHPSARVETMLVLESMGDDSVETSVNTLDSVHRLI